MIRRRALSRISSNYPSPYVEIGDKDRVKFGTQERIKRKRFELLFELVLRARERNWVVNC